MALSRFYLKSLMFLFIIGFSINAYSQQQSLIGLNLNGDVYTRKFSPSVGLTFEKQLLKHSGFETGLFYQTSKLGGVTTYTTSSGSFDYSFEYSQQYLTAPVLYKYYSRFLNFGAGPVLNVYLGWKQKNNGSGFLIDNLGVSRKVNVGFLVKAGKMIPLSKHFILEPELRFGSIPYFDNITLGIGVAGKYKF
jgi:hypothetical protein